MKKFNRQNQIVVVIDKKARANAAGFMSNTNCPIATAIKQQYNVKNVNVSPKYVRIHSRSGVEYIYDIVGDNGSSKYVEHCVSTGYDLAVILQKKD